MASRKVDIVKAYELLQMLNPDAKTAVSLVMELATRLGIDVDFEETNKIKWTQISFEYNATLGDIRVIGQGKSKKEAKQNSAQRILDAIQGQHTPNRPNHDNLGPSVSVTPHQRYSSPSPAHSSGSDSPSVSANAIGELQTLSAKKRWKLPEYEFGDYGDPNCKTFTCKVKMMSGLECLGKGSTKKSAKRQAAEKMLDILQGEARDVVDAQGCFAASPFDNRVSSPESYFNDSDLEDYPSSSSDSPLDTTTEVEDIKFNELSLTELQSKSTVQNFKFEFFSLPDQSKKGLYQVFLKLTFMPDKDQKPPIVTHGSGKTEHIAKTRAAERVLQCLNIMIN